MGENQNQPFQLSFNPSLRVDFQGLRVTSDGDLILVRESYERLGFSEPIEQHLTDSRGRTVSCLWLTCCVSLSTAGWRDMRMPTTPSGSRKIQRSADWLPQDLEAWGGADLTIAMVRDQTANTRE